MVAFPVNSTSVETRSIKRVVRVLFRMKVSKLIASGGVYNCRPVSGTTTPSQHSYGNAIDLFPTAPSSDDAEDRKKIANALVYQATHRTVVNRGIPLPIAQVIDHSGRRIWEPGKGWFAYTGDTGDHVHVSGDPMYSGPCGPRP